MPVKWSEEDLYQFYAPLLSSVFRRNASKKLSVDLAELNDYLDGYIGEACHALKSIESYLDSTCKVLEVGAGLGLVSLFLASEGIEVVANSADAEAFSKMGLLRELVKGEYPDISMTYWLGRIEGYNEEAGGFDFIFSLNVIEHMDDLPSAFSAMSSLMAPKGLMWHSCPNYAFPYEPHLGRWLLPFFPNWTVLFNPSLAKGKYGIWETLNFVTVHRVMRIMRNEALDYCFDKGVFYKHFLRLLDDPVFRLRHKRIYFFAVGLSKARVLWVLKLLPFWLVTPMSFVARHR